METEPSSMPLIEQREELYNQLFNGELPYETLAPDSIFGIASFARNVYRSGRRTREQREYLASLPVTIENVLQEHNVHSKSDAELSVFSFIDKESQKLIADLTTTVFIQWEVANMRKKNNPLLKHEESHSLIIETAAALMQVNGPENGIDLNRKKDQSVATKLITSWGPQMASEWMSGSIINRWLSEQEMSEGEKDAYLEVFTPSMRTYFAINSITNPLKAVERVKVHLDTTLSDANIAKVLDIDEADVVDVFTPGIRTHFAVNNISDPLQAIERVKVHLDTTLSDANIAEVLSMDNADVADVFTPSMRTRFAVNNISDPLKAIERVKVHLDTTLSDTNIAEVLGIDEADAADIFTPSMRTRFAVGNISDPLQAIERVKVYLDTTLSDANIAEVLGIDEADAADIFTPSIRTHFAVKNISDPLKAIERVKVHLDTTLSDANIAEVLGMDEAEVANTFTYRMRTRFAVRNISDPLDGVKKYFEGKISYGGRYRAA